jgi:outer membrane immunogenic protein
VRKGCVVFLSFIATSIALEIASAADLPAASVSAPLITPAFDWSGFYLGIEGGGGIGSSSKSFIAGTRTSDFTVSGAIGGGTVGYNVAWGSGIAGSTDCPNRMFTCGTRTNWFATVRPRVGYSFGNLMPYVTGGLAVGDVNVHSFFKPTGGGGVDFTKTEFGWTAGAGLEIPVYANWSVKAEYLYVRLADTSGPSSNPTAGVTATTTKFYENIIRAGLNYSFK